MIPIVVCTVGSKCLNVLKASVETYAPDNHLIIRQYDNSNFGDSYNQALTEVFQKYDEVIISNDDVVLHPTTMEIFISDIQKLKEANIEKLGFIATMSDNVRMSQNIRHKFFPNDEIVYGKWLSEKSIKEIPVVAPIFAWMSKKAFQEVQFPPINWYSDDVICDDMIRLGYKHFVSTAYVHHVGSSTVGTDYEKLRQEALPWIQENRPHFLEELDNRRFYNKPKQLDTTKGYYVRH